MDRIALFLLTAFGLGRIPRAPGTVGSLPPVALAALLAWTGASPATINAALLLLATLFALVCLRFGAVGERRFGRKDPGAVVADEVAGQSVALLLLPWGAPEGGGMAWNLALCGAGFVLFRTLDILKPWPIGAVQSLRGGAGILADDLVAGALAALLLGVGLVVAGLPAT